MLDVVLHRNPRMYLSTYALSYVFHVLFLMYDVLPYVVDGFYCQNDVLCYVDVMHDASLHVVSLLLSSLLS